MRSESVVSLARTKTHPDRRSWLGELARRLVVDRLLLDEARLVGADQEATMLEAERAVHRDSYSDAYLREAVTAPRVMNEEIESFYRENRERFERPERRQTYNLFKAHREGTSREKLETELLELRQRVVNGESFQKLARESSDSETRFRDGLLGVLERGRFSDDFDRIVFGLDEGVPSEPVINSDGGHLFYVETIFEARSVGLEEARVLIAEELGEARRREHLASVASSLPLPEGKFRARSQ